MFMKTEFNNVCSLYCSWLSVILFKIFTPYSSSTILTNMNNVDKKTLFNSVFNTIGQVENFLLCTCRGVASLKIYSRYENFKVLSHVKSLEIDCFHSQWTQKYLHNGTYRQGGYATVYMKFRLYLYGLCNRRK